jgi:hypothetical protein
MGDRYLLNDEEPNRIESPEEMFHRVAAHLATNEKDVQHWTSEFERVMLAFDFISAGSLTRLVSNCVVLHMKDSLTSNFQTLKEVRDRIPIPSTQTSRIQMQAHHAKIFRPIILPSDLFGGIPHCSAE